MFKHGSEVETTEALTAKMHTATMVARNWTFMLSTGFVENKIRKDKNSQQGSLQLGEEGLFQERLWMMLLPYQQEEQKLNETIETRRTCVIE